MLLIVRVCIVTSKSILTNKQYKSTLEQFSNLNLKERINVSHGDDSLFKVWNALKRQSSS